MTEYENNDVNQESVAPYDSEGHSQAQENQYGYEDSSHQEVGQPEDDKEKNFKALRESNAQLQRKAEENERQAREYAERLERLERALQENQKAPVTQEQMDELEELASDDWTTKAYLDKYTEKVVSKRVEKQLKDFYEKQELTRQEQEKQRQLQELPKRLEKEHPDFESVVTKENVEYLKANKPHIAKALAATQDPYEQAKAAYDMIKTFCPNAAQTDDQERMNRNAAKPGTLGAAKAQSPLSGAKQFEKGLTRDLKQKLYAEMMAARKAS